MSVSHSFRTYAIDRRASAGDFNKLGLGCHAKPLTIHRPSYYLKNWKARARIRQIRGTQHSHKK